MAGTTGGIQGTVSDAAGHPLSNVQVSVVAGSGRGSAVTAANGFYSLNGLPLDTYAVTFTKEGYDPQTIPGVTTIQDQVTHLDAKLQSGVKTLDRVTVRGSTSLVQPRTTADTYVINQQSLQNLNGTPQDLNGFQAFNSLPGVTTDNFGYPVIRAGAENDIGYQLDGVDNTDAVTGQFLNAVSLNGARSVQLSTGGYDVSSGNTNTGVINEVIRRGSFPGSGQTTLRVINPIFGHEITFDYGGATPNNRFSYYFSYGGQRNADDFGDRHTLLPLQLALQDYSTLNDEVLNLFYHFGQGDKNELQFLSQLSGQTLQFGYLVGPSVAPYASNNGNVQAGSDPFGLGSAANPTGFVTNPQFFLSNYITLYPGQLAYNQNINAYDTQTYNTTIDKLNFKRQLSSSSFAEVRVFRTSENLVSHYPYNLGSFSDSYFDLQTLGLGTAFDYTSQINSQHELTFGGDATYYKSYLASGIASLQPTQEPLELFGCPQIAAAIAAGTLPASVGGIASVSNPGVGGCYIAPLNAVMNGAVSGLGLPTDPAHAPLNTFVNNAAIVNDPLHRYDLYVKDRFQPTDKLTLTFGLRFDKQVITLPADAAANNMTWFMDDTVSPAVLRTAPGQAIGADVTAPSQISPRMAIAYELGARDTLRFSFGKNIEFIPEQAIENKFNVDPALKNCNIANGCFVPLPGGPGSAQCLAAPSGCTNNVTSLYQQVILDLNTNSFAQYTPVRPQRAINYDASWEHDFGHGLELRITPYYRKGTDYVVGSAPLLFTLRSGTPVFGATREFNAGVNKNFGIEFALQRQVRYGLSGLLDATYDNTLANYDSDFFPTVNAAALAAGHFFHVSYVSPLVATLNLALHTRSGFSADTTIGYEAGYAYGVGKKKFVFTNINGQTVPVQVLNTDLVSTLSQAYYVTDPTNPGDMFRPNITGSRGTAEGDDPGTLHGPPVAIVNVTLSQELGKGPHNVEAGVRVGNLFGNYTPSIIPSNLYYQFQGLGAYGPGSGINPNACPPGQNLACEPFMYNQSPHPYENESRGLVRTFTFFVSAKY